MYLKRLTFINLIKVFQNDFSLKYLLSLQSNKKDSKQAQCFLPGASWTTSDSRKTRNPRKPRKTRKHRKLEILEKLEILDILEELVN